MTTIVKIDGKAIQLDEFVRTLKLTGTASRLSSSNSSATGWLP